MKNNVSIFDKISSVVITDYIDNSPFAIVRNGITTVIKDYSNGNMLYKFDCFNGTINATEIDCDIAHVNADNLKKAIRAYWYNLELSIVNDTKKELALVNDKSIATYCKTANITGEEKTVYINKYNTLVKRLSFVSDTCKQFNIDSNVGNTVKAIVSVYHNNKLCEGYENEVKAIDTELEKVNACVDKNNNQLNVGELKKSIDAFTKKVWLPCESDGIETYTYNANTRLCVSVIGQCRKLTNNNGREQWAKVSTDRLVKTVVKAMLSRLYELKHADDNADTDNKKSDNKKSDKK